MTKPTAREPYIAIPIPTADIPKLLKGADSAAGQFFKNAVLEEITKKLTAIGAKQ
jgi:hypothetical protein